MGEIGYNEISDNVVVMYPSKPRNPMNDAPQTVPTTCIALPNELIFVDCGIYPELAAKFRTDMEKKYQRKCSHLFLTHTHWDHIMAMEVFEDTNVVASESGIEDLKNFITNIKNTEHDKWPTLLNTEDKEVLNIMKTVELFLPNTGVKKELIFELKEHEIIYRVIGGHSMDSAYVFVPSERIICIGDNLIECYAQLPGNPSEAIHIHKHLESLDFEYAIPGHGKVVKKDFVLAVKSYFENLISALEKLIEQKVPRKEIVNHPSIPQYFGKNRLDWTEGCFPNSNWIEMTIRSWYRSLKFKR
jgi:glyoxylase-like metal-dependent hydrolase (beta-lactamase superfamily II)